MFPVVIPAAGYGTRSLPASKAIPKEMLTVFDRPTIQYIAEEAAASGAKSLVLVTSRGKSAIEDHFDRNIELEAILEKAKKNDLLAMVRGLSELIQIKSLRQHEMRGLGHAVLSAKPAVSTRHFGVILGDDLVDAPVPGMQQLFNRWKEISSTGFDGGVVMLMKVEDSEVSKYGICEVESSSLKIQRCIEKPKPSDTNSRLAIIGRYLLPSDIFSKLENLGSGALGEIQLTDALNILAREGRLYGHILEGKRFDAGDRLGFLEASIHFAMKSGLKSEVQKLLKEILK